MRTVRFSLTAVAHASFLAALLAGVSSQAHAQLNLQTEPQGARVSAPAPNIIVSVDDSGSMWGTGMTTLKQSLRQTFSDTTLLPDGKVRLAWQSMTLCSGFPGVNGGCSNNGMRELSGQHRTNFLNWVNGIDAVGWTPSFSMFVKAGDYLSATGLGVNSPWAYNPGVQAEPVLSCRKSFHIFLSDGGYNDSYSIGNIDNSQRTLPDGTVYTPNTDQTKLYSDGVSNTLGDVAFHYWARDLQPGIPNDVPARWADLNGQKNYYQNNTENFGTASAPATLNPYWNPRNNPATWQNMVNYTIGFMSAATWSGNPIWRGESNTGLSPLIRREATWPNHPYPDHWHAAVNSRGRFVPVQNPSELTSAFRAILSEINDQSTGAPSAVVGSNLRIGSPGFAYVSSFDGIDWSGTVQAFPIGADGSQSGSTPAWDAGKLLNTRTTTRRILTVNSGTGQGVTFDWSNLSDTQKALLNGGDTLGPQRVEYIAGSINAHSSFRARSNRMGSIVNSVPLYVGPAGSAQSRSAAYMAFARQHSQRPPVTYVGSSSGKLHAFDATTGQELMAYVPQGAYTKLRALTTPSYEHQYIVDGSPFSADADMRSEPGSGAANWRTVVVGTMGLGGRGYFALDGTQPGAFASTSPRDIVLIDRSAPGTTGSDADIGYIASPPVLDNQGDSRSEQIVRLNNNRWAVLMGNGVNSPNERPVLLIQYLDGARELITRVASTTIKQGNGLGSPRAVDLDGNGTTDLVYAGDQKGQVWRFDLLGADVGNWKVGLDGQPLVKGITTQPITAAPYWLPHPRGGLQIAFGTGRQLATSDPANKDTQTLFGVRDSFSYSRSNGAISLSGSTPVTSLSQLVQQTVASTREGFTTTTRNAVDYTQRSGWYLHLPVSGERMLENPSLLQGRLVEFVTQSPNSAPAVSCKVSYGSGSTYISYLDIINGAPPAASLFTPITTDPRYQANRYQGSGLRVISRSLLGRKDIAVDPVNGSSGKSVVDIKFSLSPTRVDWRQLR